MAELPMMNKNKSKQLKNNNNHDNNKQIIMCSTVIHQKQNPKDYPTASSKNLPHERAANTPGRPGNPKMLREVETLVTGRARRPTQIPLHIGRAAGGLRSV